MAYQVFVSDFAAYGARVAIDWASACNVPGRLIASWLVKAQAQLINVGE